MVSLELQKRWKVTRTLLERAHRAIPCLTAQEETQIVELQNEFKECLDHNELELALDKLEAMGDIVPCRGEFWRDLERAADTMELKERTLQLHVRFLSIVRPD